MTTTTRAQAIIRDYRLDPECIRYFEQAVEDGYLVLPTSSGLYSQVHRAFESYCLEEGLPVILVEEARNHSGQCSVVHVYHAPTRLYETTSRVGTFKSVLDPLTPWEVTCREAMDRFGFDLPNPACDSTRVTFENDHWTRFQNFPSTTIRDLAAFLERKIRDRLLEEGRQK